MRYKSSKCVLHVLESSMMSNERTSKKLDKWPITYWTVGCERTQFTGNAVGDSVATAWVFSQDLGFFETILGSWVFSEGLGFFLGFSKRTLVFSWFFFKICPKIH